MLIFLGFLPAFQMAQVLKWPRAVNCQPRWKKKKNKKTNQNKNSQSSQPRSPCLAPETSQRKCGLPLSQLLPSLPSFMPDLLHTLLCSGSKATEMLHSMQNWNRKIPICTQQQQAKPCLLTST